MHEGEGESVSKVKKYPNTKYKHVPYSTDILRFKLFEILFLQYLSLLKFLFFEHPVFRDFCLRSTGFSKYRVFDILYFRNHFFGYIFRSFFLELIFFDLSTPTPRLIVKCIVSCCL
jgi:hypothetical protein